MMIVVKKQEKTGFTLVELLVVIGIMSILTIVSVAQFGTARKRARDTQRKGDISAVSRALLSYYADQGAFPAILDLTAGGELRNPSGDYIYMKVLPKENYGTLGIPNYCYVVDSSLTKFGLFAQLETATDADCKTPAYVHCTGNNYCFATVSPNTTATELGGTNP